MFLMLILNLNIRILIVIYLPTLWFFFLTIRNIISCVTMQLMILLINILCYQIAKLESRIILESVPSQIIYIVACLKNKIMIIRF